MAEKLQKLSVVTPQKVIYADEVRFVKVRGTAGELGILPEHAPLITSLDIGVAHIQKDNQWKKVAVHGGFMEVGGNRTIILANTAELADDIDVARAQRAKERAEERLASKSADIDLVRAEAALKRALARLEAADAK
ncbi:MAG: F0F1 ATP synthase subunit epsilon [Peptococcaceae bacterium]|nr:F0F1 ATP synthase subunit epsilon [Peptococcaceae bacterium]